VAEEYAEEDAEEEKETPKEIISKPIVSQAIVS
jgi:hypothetical protein